jgi:regulator of protease activity HflC (stomatin/prohibitin superfamily)
MKKILALSLLSMFAFMGCGEKVSVPPAHVGKILTKNGYAPDTVPPSKFRLPVCFAYCDKLIVLEASDRGLRESMTLFMPKDKLNIKVDIRGTMSVPNDQKTVDYLFSRLTASEGETDDYHGKITAIDVYSTYGQQALRGIVRSELVKYTIGDVLQNREAIGQNIHAAISEKLKSTNTPLILSRFELADVQPPETIVNAQKAAKEREIAIQQAEADAKVAIVEAERALEIAKKDRLVEREKALAIAEQNKIAAKSITPQLLMYRKLEVAERIMTELANSKNQGLIVVPTDMTATTGVIDATVFSKVLGKELGGK